MMAALLARARAVADEHAVVRARKVARALEAVMPSGVAVKADGEAVTVEGSAVVDHYIRDADFRARIRDILR